MDHEGIRGAQYSGGQLPLAQASPHPAMQALGDIILRPVTLHVAQEKSHVRGAVSVPVVRLQVGALRPREAKLMAQDVCVVLIPAGVTDEPPAAIVVELHAPLVGPTGAAASQSGLQGYCNGQKFKQVKICY